MLKQFTDWLFNLAKAWFLAAWDFVTDLLIGFFDLVVTAFVSLISAVPVPAWLQSGLGSTWGGMDSGVLYIATQCGVPAALGIIGAGYAFRLTRKFLTLFQW